METIRITAQNDEDAFASPSAALREAVRRYGSQVATAVGLGVTQGAVSKWLSGQKPLPPKHVLKVEADTGVSRHALAPDIYPAGSGATTPTTPAYGVMAPAR